LVRPTLKNDVFTECNKTCIQELRWVLFSGKQRKKTNPHFEKTLLKKLGSVLSQVCQALETLLRSWESCSSASRLSQPAAWQCCCHTGRRPQALYGHEGPQKYDEPNPHFEELGPPSTLLAAAEPQYDALA
jgi:hypothetical protein